MSKDRAKIISRVKKLREVRVDRGATKEEAATAKLLANKLVEKYSITEEDINNSERNANNFLDAIFGDQEEYSHERKENSETFRWDFTGPKRGPKVGSPIEDFFRAFMGSGMGAFFQEMRDAAEGSSSFEKGLFEAIDVLLRNWGAKGDRKREDNKEDSEAPDSKDGGISQLP